MRTLTGRLQAATYFVTDVMGLAIEMKYHAFGFYKIWNEPRIARKLIGVLLITNTFGSLSCAFDVNNDRAFPESCTALTWLPLNTGDGTTDWPCMLGLTGCAPSCCYSFAHGTTMTAEASCWNFATSPICSATCGAGNWLATAYNISAVMLSAQLSGVLHMQQRSCRVHQEYH